MATATPASPLPPGLPPDVYQWGAPTAEFAVPPGRAVINLIAGMFALIPALGMAIGGSVALFLSLFGDTPWKHRGYMGLAASLGIGFTVGIIFWVKQSFATEGTRVWLFSRGLVRLGRGAAEACRWEEIQSVQQEMNTGSRERAGAVRHRFTISRRDGTQMSFEGIPKVRALGEQIQQESLKYLLPPVLKTYHSGQPVTFGSLTLSGEGVNNGKETVPWVEIKGVEIDKNGQLVFTAQGRWFSFAKMPIADIPNVHVLLALVRQRRGAS